jgi:tRNA pseudouridine32 synthase/23S rRNA pseudouridine746 synthase
MPEVLHCDDFLIAVNKPTRLLTVPGKGPDKQDCLYRRVLDMYSDARVVHRLDMDTSGLVLFARSPEAQRHCSRQFEQREIDKTYMAVVEGVMEESTGTIDYPMRKDMAQRLPPKHLIDCIRGKKAVTEWELLEQSETTARLALYPRTGRSHQLRLHLQSIGHPVVGDPIYGRPAGRLMLHAARLKLQHPATGEPLVLACPAPF